ncbi:uncharacterized protein C5orf49 homolog [Dendronephthya gigantea]|uniref:uncharacterized protein C5orf49 homolog n=1 Tax=Dendronephthya gigantea TaxID=151771 RepID=UPI00106DA74C|nr:uncharacterized protein C5orf49 homolog [Dendronephthya gigantea]
MSAFDTPRKLSFTYPSEEQRNQAIDIMRPSGLSSQVYNRQQLHKRICEAERESDIPMLSNESYFKAQTKRSQPSTYDRINHVTCGYDQKLHRDDRAFAKSRGLHVNKEEKSVCVPSLSSSIYGHPSREPLEVIDRKHFSVQTCKKDFLRVGGTNIGSNPDLH